MISFRNEIKFSAKFLGRYKPLFHVYREVKSILKSISRSHNLFGFNDKEIFL